MNLNHTNIHFLSYFVIYKHLLFITELVIRDIIAIGRVFLNLKD